MRPLLHPSFFAETLADKPAVLMAGSGGSVSYAGLEYRSNQIAQWARAQHLRHGDHVALVLENDARFFEIIWGVQRCGLYFTPISTRLTADDVAFIVQDCGARAVLVSANLAELATELAQRIGPDVERYAVGGALAGYRSWQEAIDGHPGTPVSDEVAGSIMLYSSGTTGRPKGIKFPLVAEPIGTITAVTDKLRLDYRFDEHAVFLSTAPLYHSAPLYFNMLAMRVGATSVIMEKFDAEQFLALVEKHRVTHAQLVPTMFVRLLKLPPEVRSRYDLSSLRFALHGAGPCAVEVKQRMIDWWGPILHDYYGGTEAVGVVSITSEEWLQHRGSVGRPGEGRVAIVGEDGSILGPGEVGDVYFTQGRSFEYHNDPEKTLRARNERGWSTLGDMGYLDDDGYLYLTDRRSDLVITGGVNIYPQEIEHLLCLHDKVADAAVFGVPNEEFGEELKAVVQPVRMGDVELGLEAELMAYCAKHLAKLKRPRSIEFLAQLPRHETGKLYKRLLRDRYWAGRPSKLV
jgi:long-chain acyl-CoA synthetase